MPVCAVIEIGADQTEQSDRKYYLHFDRILSRITNLQLLPLLLVSAPLLLPSPPSTPNLQEIGEAHNE